MTEEERARWTTFSISANYEALSAANPAASQARWGAPSQPIVGTLVIQPPPERTSHALEARCLHGSDNKIRSADDPIVTKDADALKEWCRAQCLDRREGAAPRVAIMRGGGIWGGDAYLRKLIAP